MISLLSAIFIVLFGLQSVSVLNNYTEEDSPLSRDVQWQKKLLDNNLIFNLLSTISILVVLYDIYLLKTYFQIGWIAYAICSMVLIAILRSFYKFLWIAIIPDLIFGRGLVTRSFAIPDYVFHKLVNITIGLMVVGLVLNGFVLFL
jgi:hypothetical protein